MSAVGRYSNYWIESAVSCLIRVYTGVVQHGQQGAELCLCSATLTAVAAPDMGLGWAEPPAKCLLAPSRNKLVNNQEVNCAEIFKL